MPETFDELITELQRRQPSLSASQRKVAERVLADPEAVAFMTISELAAGVGVNEATVVRFANNLGLKGYPGLAHLCRQRLREQAQLLQRYDDLARSGSSGEDLLHRATTFDQANISRTMSRIEPEVWDAAITALCEAPRVHVMGQRKCHAPAYLLGYLLHLVREDVETVAGAAGTLADELRRVRAGDCFVALGIHRYSMGTVRAAQWAQDRGARTVALTDTPASPLARAADQVFYVDVSGPSILRSVTAFTSLTQALTAGVAQALGHQARSTLLEEESLLRDFHAYADDDLP